MLTATVTPSPAWRRSAIWLNWGATTRPSPLRESSRPSARLTIVHRQGEDGAKLSNGYQLTGIKDAWRPRPKNPPTSQPLTVAHMAVAREEEQNAAKQREDELLQRIEGLEEQISLLTADNARLRSNDTPLRH